MSLPGPPRSIDLYSLPLLLWWVVVMSVSGAVQVTGPGCPAARRRDGRFDHWPTHSRCTLSGPFVQNQSRQVPRSQLPPGTVQGGRMRNVEAYPRATGLQDMDGCHSHTGGAEEPGLGWYRSILLSVGGGLGRSLTTHLAGWAVRDWCQLQNDPSTDVKIIGPQLRRQGLQRLGELQGALRGMPPPPWMGAQTRRGPCTSLTRCTVMLST